ncbi:hypothetical protein KUTeg_000003 [Tegillarca granosa]|uniref:Uncharacterized protein n=1 Tax=Tegillarca granosa TaxID=220873 RepID=A0ABQ9FYY3_TEGGR|nr:hypothetical protein KUTeg_000003 [Tegillarca granosa]
MEIKFTVVFFTLLIYDVTADVCEQHICQCNAFDAYVDCSGRQLTDIPSGIPINTTHLDLSVNNLTTVSSTALKDLLNLTTINLSWNKFENDGIEPGALDLPMLTTVDLAQNDIETFPSKIFSKTLTSLNYSHNNMGAMEAGDFAETPSLVFLDISDNGLEAIPSEPSSFSSLKNINELWIADNNLRTLDPMVLGNQFMPHLSIIYVGGNPWYCDCHLKWLKQMSELPSGVIQEIHSIRCSGPDPLKDKRFDKLRAEDFVCK